MPSVKLDNDKWVKDPIFYGKEWFLDCREEAILIVHIYRQPKEENLLRRMRKILRDNGIPAKIIKDEESHRDIFAFPPNFRGLKQSASVRLEFLPLPMPASLACYANVWVRTRPEGEVVNECIESIASDGDVD